jgi:hypothetical protein
MRKTLLAAAAVLVAKTGALAGTTKIAFDNFCDGMKIVSDDKVHYVSIQTGKCLDGVLVMGIGYKVGQKTGARVVLGVNWEAFDGHLAGSEQYAYRLQYPFVTGGAWEEILTTDGSTFTVLNTGTYTVVGKPKEGSVGSMLSFMPER